MVARLVARGEAPPAEEVVPVQGPPPNLPCGQPKAHDGMSGHDRAHGGVDPLVLDRGDISRGGPRGQFHSAMDRERGSDLNATFEASPTRVSMTAKRSVSEITYSASGFS